MADCFERIASVELSELHPTSNEALLFSELDRLRMRRDEIDRAIGAIHLYLESLISEQFAGEIVPTIEKRRCTRSPCPEILD
jgi:hypothetical protein